MVPPPSVVSQPGIQISSKNPEAGGFNDGKLLAGQG